MFTQVSRIPANFHDIIHLQTRGCGDISVLMTHFLIVHNYESPSLLILANSHVFLSLMITHLLH